MTDEKSHVASAGEDLFNFAIDRRDVTAALERLPGQKAARKALVAHELQMLKIISVGWSLSYHLANSPIKQALMIRYWELVREFSGQLDQTTALLVHRDISFFETVRARFNAYLEKMETTTGAPEPAVVIGPVFAEHCGSAGEPHTVMAGARLFIGAVAQVRTYLENAGLH